MNTTVWVWAQSGSGDLEYQGEHAYYVVHHNIVTDQWMLGRRLGDQPIKLVGIYDTEAEAKSAAELREASL